MQGLKLIHVSKRGPWSGLVLIRLFAKIGKLLLNYICDTHNTLQLTERKIIPQETSATHDDLVPGWFIDWFPGNQVTILQV